MSRLPRRCAVVVLPLIWALAAAAGTPTERVRQAVGDVVGVLKESALDREQRWEKIGMVINRSFDFQAMSQSVLATHWQQASSAERERFVEFFSQYLEDTYRNKIEGYTDQQIRYVGEQIDGERASVDTVIVTSGTEIPVTYRLRLNDGEWYAYDVVIEGVSLVNNYRTTFAAIVRAEGMEGVLGDLQERIARYKIEQAAGAAPAPLP
ncbi:MAG: ABC transporter substrate-binding protein [Gammaproteobacteria bacterium]|nr:ABC transporter substrate-binding protein [Gammaproteobacteria bacterium]